MSTYKHELTEIETACGVTLDDVATQLPKCLGISDGRVVVPSNIGPALAASVARCFLASPTVFLGFNAGGYPVYGKDETK